MKHQLTIAAPSHKLNRRNTLLLLQFLLDRACRSTPLYNEVCLVVTDDAGIREINSTHLGHDYSTDVITFTYDPIPGQETPLRSGEIVVNLELARRLTRWLGSADRELALYIAHGCDHLSGEDDQTQFTRRRMRRRELRWLAEASRLNLLAGLLRA